MKEYDVKLYSGWPETSGDTLEEMVEKGCLEAVEAGMDGCYDLCPGIYSCHVTGEGIYPTLKVISVPSEQKITDTAALVQKDVVALRMAGNHPQGYQPTVVVPDAPEFFKRTQKDELLCIWPDEILDVYGDGTVPKHHQCMMQHELEEQLGMLENECLQLYSMGVSLHYGLHIPLAVLSKEILPPDSWEDALGKLRDSKKVNIFYQGQIHGNEPAACDGALEVIKGFCGQKELQDLLDYVNLVIVPRANPEAAYLYRRMAYDNIDLNRDHMAGDAYETRLLHKAFQLLEPEVLLDGHEFTFFVTETEDGKGFVAKGAEIMSSPATSLNMAESVRNCSYAVCGQVFENLKAMGYRINHFGTAEKASVGRGFYGLHQCLSFLVETRGIGGGQYGYERRVEAQRDIMLSYIRTAAAAADEIKETVKTARTCNLPHEIVLQHGSSESVCTPYKGINEQYYLDGSLRGRTEDGLQLNDLALRKRKRTGAYVMPADAEHIDAIIDKVKGIGCHVEPVAPGTTLNVERYHCMGLREEEAHEKDIVAELLPAEEVTFEKGGYCFHGKDFRGVPLAMLMEPDVTDTVGTKGTLFQQDLMDYDKETGLFPLNRADWL